MEVPKSTQTRCRDSRITKLNIHSPIPTSFSHVTLIYTVCPSLYQAALELPSIPIVFIALVIKLELFMLQLTCEKDDTFEYASTPGKYSTLGNMVQSTNS